MYLQTLFNISDMMAEAKLQSKMSGSKLVCKHSLGIYCWMSQHYGSFECTLFECMGELNSLDINVYI